MTFKYVVKLEVSLGVPEIKGLFGNVVLITLFIFFKNTY